MNNFIHNTIIYLKLQIIAWFYVYIMLLANTLLKNLVKENYLLL